MLVPSFSPLRVALVALGTLAVLVTVLRLAYISYPIFTARELLIGDHYRQPKAPAHARVGKVSVAVNELDNDVIRRAFLSHQKQNEIHGYPHFIARHEAVAKLSAMHKDQSSGAWTKPAYLLAVVVDELQKPNDERMEWVFWFDADTIVLNPQTKLEAFLPPYNESDFDDLHLLISSNWDGINSGAFALRVHPWTVSLLSAVLAYPIYKNDRLERDRFRDQSAFHWLLEGRDSPLTQSPTRGREHWIFVPMRWFNLLPFNNVFDKKNGTWLVGKQMEGELFDNGTTQVYDDGHGRKIQPWKVMQGDMVVHFAGFSASGTRDSWMGPWLERAEAALPEWTNGTTQTDIRADAERFWNEEARRQRKLRSAEQASSLS